MNSYALVPVTCVAIYCFLLFSFIASKKDIMIKAYMYVLVAMILWTGGSFLMRINMFPSYEFWFNISILGLLSCVFTLFSFVIVYINKKYDFNCYFWIVVLLVLALINAATGFFISPPVLTNTPSGYKFIYESNIFSYILYGVTIVCALNLVLRITKAIKSNSDFVKELLPLFIGIVVMLLGHVLYFLPVFKGFPIDVLSGVVMAFCMYYMVYQLRLFKLTLLVSKLNIQFMSVLCSALIFFYSISPIERFVTKYLAAFAKYKTFIITIMFVMVVYVIFYFFKVFIDHVFIKNEIKQNEALNDFSLEVSKSLVIDDVLELTIHNIKEVINVNDILIALLNEDNKEYVIYPDKKYFSYPSINAKCQIFNFLNECNRCVSYHDFTRSIYYRSLWQKDKEYLANLNIEMMIPLKEDKLLGVIFLGKKGKGNYNYDEVVYLSSIASIATIAFQNSRLYQKVYHEATHDELTGLYNRKYFYHILEKQYEDINDSLVLMNISIDDFRLYNQLYGNVIGDEALVKVANIIKATVAKNGFVARNQGKEFSIILPDYTILQAKNLAEDIRLQVLNINKNSSISAKVLTVSIGIAAIPFNASDVKQLIEYTDHATFLAKKAGKNCISIYNLDTIALNDYNPNKPNKSVYSEYSNTIYALQAAIDTKDHYTFSHSNNVCYYATTLAKEYGLNDDIVEIIREAALLHDVGKIGIPEHILNKQSRLTNEEYEIMKTHVDNSIGIIKHLPSLDYVIPAVVSHHERWDGKGYPRKLAGNDIPLSGRILCIADCFDAMTSARCYRQPYTVDKACQEIINQANKKFDPQLAYLFVDLVKQNKIVIKEG